MRANTGEGNGTTFDLQGRLVLCEGGNRRVTRTSADGRIEVLMDRFEGKRLNRPNDVVCKSDGSIYFTDPGLRVPLAERELPYAGRLSHRAGRRRPRWWPTASIRTGSPSRRTSACSTWPTRAGRSTSTRSSSTPDGALVRRRIFADMSSDETDGVPDGMKVDVEGRVYCTGPGGTWVFAPDGTRLGHHPHPGGPGQPRLRRPRSPDAVLHRAHLGLHAARQGARAAAPLVSDPTR